MGELIRIGAEDGAPGLSATIDTTGAWVTDLSLGGKPILFPRQTLVAPDGSEKVRGGMHVCSPYFGLPTSKSKIGEPQHGYGRTVEWDVDYIDSTLACLSHKQEDGYYDGLVSDVAFSIRQDRRLTPVPCFDAIIRLTNNSSSLRRIPVSPGFHPYFDALTGFQDLDTDSPELYLDGSTQNDGKWRAINLRNRRGQQMGLLSFNLTEAIQWTDRLADYVCIEPVLSTCGLLGDQDTAACREIMLEPEQSGKFHIGIAVGLKIRKRNLC